MGGSDFDVFFLGQKARDALPFFEKALERDNFILLSSILKSAAFDSCGKGIFIVYEKSVDETLRTIRWLFETCNAVVILPVFDEEPNISTLKELGQLGVTNYLIARPQLSLEDIRRKFAIVEGFVKSKCVKERGFFVSRLKQLIEAVPAAYYIFEKVNGSPRLIYMSESFFKLTGFRLEEVESFPDFRKIIYPDDLQHFENKWVDHLVQVEYRIVGKDRQRIRIRDISVPITDYNGRILGWRGILIDVTEHILARKGMKFMSEISRFSISSLDINETAQVLVGKLYDMVDFDYISLIRLDRKDMYSVIARKCKYPERFRKVSHEPIGEELPVVQMVLKKMHFVTNDVEKDSWAFGDEFFKKKISSCGFKAMGFFPVLTSKGAVFGMLLVGSMEPRAFTPPEIRFFRAISEHIGIVVHAVETYHGLRKAYHDWKTTIDSINDVLIVITPDRKVTLANEVITKMTGFSVSEILGKDIVELLKSTGNHEVAKRLDDMLKQVEKENITVSDVLPVVLDNKKRYLDVTVYHRREDAEKRRKFIIVAKDITLEHGLQEEILMYHERLEQMFIELAVVVGHVVERRDPYTSGHSENVASLSVMIGEMLGLNEKELIGLKIAALLHDAGKIAVPAEILFKPGELSELEWEFMKLHPIIGYEIIKNVDFPWPVQEGVLQHHERLDGSGYPYGLKGDEISLFARIIAVADVVDAITSFRPYRPAIPLSVAIDELIAGKGVKYDPNVVDACLTILKEKRWQKPEIRSLS